MIEFQTTTRPSVIIALPTPYQIDKMAKAVHFKHFPMGEFADEWTYPCDPHEDDPPWVRRFEVLTLLCDDKGEITGTHVFATYRMCFHSWIMERIE